jgi:spermidine synthase
MSQNSQLNGQPRDPILIAIFERLFPAEAAKAFSDPRVRAHSGDGRRFLQASIG